ncbi:hypothetical protein A2382_04635 [Candidatus Woesebacteria bacterium RIFOXYB1_FULL_38_16]|uniref:Uncharacterized protein n=1 Tax=Candidatus Woesebacteria bacterium RIFOXYB1_FULL_38_16 TaxID=1802538 RepID=A0A1F8CV36_9BACT|nr:MAG: hypothetical protein A2191_02110 [Candidatus Woesebacteria bacterium RIFOXYA1_FULL_38_9]OGM79946.1 MAG: hypothetical protein A2382_04635 [Candidatus Woesebacteria bacterium RIFOXYB1_FULL_38_16]
MKENKEIIKTGLDREVVVQAFCEFVLEGVTHLDELLVEEGRVKEANKLLDRWTVQEERRVEQVGTLEERLRFNLSQSTVFVDAGFSDPQYLEEVIDDWLDQDLHNAEEAGLDETASLIQKKIEEIKARI